MARDRRSFCAALLAAGLACRPAHARTPMTVTDMTGRTVRLPAPPRRIVLLEARDMLSMALVHPDPASLVVGWAAVDRIDSGWLQNTLQDGRDITVVGQQTPETVSIEKLASLWPDLVVANFYMAPQGRGDPLVGRLEKFGIPVIFSDLSSNADDGASSAVLPSLRHHMRMWGEVLEAQARAAAYTRFFEERVDRVRARLDAAAPVTTYLEIQSSVDDCCWVAGRRIWGELLELAGGATLKGVTAPWFQQLALEYLLSTPQDVYIASGGGWPAGGRPAIGPGLEPGEGRRGLARLTARTGFSGLPSVRNRRVHGIWTGLITVPPLNVLFVECAAKWLHPERCGDIDPGATLAEINLRFLARPIDGPLWISMKE